MRTREMTNQYRLNQIALERLREHTVISTLVVNHLHDARILDPTDLTQQVHLTLDTLIDGDIPARIEVRKDSAGSAWITWRLWPVEPGLLTWGSMSLGRLSVTRAILTTASYDRSLARSARLARISIPDAKWGVSSATCTRFGIETTF